MSVGDNTWKHCWRASCSQPSWWKQHKGSRGKAGTLESWSFKRACFAVQLVSSCFVFVFGLLDGGPSLLMFGFNPSGREKRRNGNP